MDLAAVRVAVRSFHAARARAAVAVHAGRPGNALSFDLKRAPLAADPEALALVRQEATDATGRRQQRLRHLEKRIVENIALASNAHVLEARDAAFEAAIQGTEDRPRLPFLLLLDALSRQSDRNERERMVSRASEKTEPLYAAWARQVEAAQKAGLDLSAPASDARTLLRVTEAMYAEVLGWWLRRRANLKPFPQAAEAHDVLWVLGDLPFDALVRPGDVTSLGAFLRAPWPDAALSVDASATERRRAGALVAAPDAPREVLVSHRSRGGFDDARSMLEAVGSALHWAGADPDAPAEDRLLGDPAVRTATGKTFAMLLLDKPWSKKRLGVDNPDFTRVLALSDLFKARLEAALLVGTHDAMKNGASAAQISSMAESVSEATLGRWTPELLTFALRDPFQAAEDVTARTLGLSLFEGLRERCDEDWWANPRSQAVLSSFFEPGGLHDPETLAGHLGFSPPSAVAMENAWLPSLD